LRERPPRPARSTAVCAANRDRASAKGHAGVVRAAAGPAVGAGQAGTLGEA
jgi:hypothetical protein